MDLFDKVTYFFFSLYSKKPILQNIENKNVTYGLRTMGRLDKKILSIEEMTCILIGLFLISLDTTPPPPLAWDNGLW